VSPPISALVISLIISSILLVPTVRLLKSKNMLDVPGTRSSHTVPTPRGAGIALAPSALVALLVTATVPIITLLAIVGFSLIGALDDWRRRSARSRLAAQLVLALIIVVPFARWTEVKWWYATIIIILSALLLTYTVNAVNFMDGINGITALNAIVMGAGLTWVCLWGGAPEWGPIGLTLVGVSIAFLPWNWGRQARVFLGDSGSYLIGALVGALILAAAIAGPGVLIALAPIAIYFSDTGSAILQRLLRRESIMVAHRDHIYQKLTELGWSHPQVAVFVSSFSAICSICAVITVIGTMPTWCLVIIVLFVCSIYLQSPRLLRRFKSRRP
jgi:UDP-GlcNAc:undecaprenyl-phosphate GlcNAc-1-phosphate transferase